MFQAFGRLACVASLGAACVLSTPAQADVIDFDAGELVGLYLPGDSFAQAGYTLTTWGDFGIVDSAVALGTSSPSGNPTQFYFNSNDGTLSLARTDATLFNLTGFSAAFVPLDPAPLQDTVIVARGLKADNTTVIGWWAFADSNTSHYPFTAYAGAGFEAFTGLQKLEFGACSLIGTAVCTAPTLNNAQFAVDNIIVSSVPEPGTTLLLTLGLLGLGLRARRAAR